MNKVESIRIILNNYSTKAHFDSSFIRIALEDLDELEEKATLLEASENQRKLLAERVEELEQLLKSEIEEHELTGKAEESLEEDLEHWQEKFVDQECKTEALKEDAELGKITRYFFDEYDKEGHKSICCASRTMGHVAIFSKERFKSWYREQKEVK